MEPFRRGVLVLEQLLRGVQLLYSDLGLQSYSTEDTDPVACAELLLHDTYGLVTDEGVGTRAGETDLHLGEASDTTRAAGGHGMGETVRALGINRVTLGTETCEATTALCNGQDCAVSETREV